MDFGILGPLRIRVADNAVVVRAAKQRSLAAGLILHANKIVTVDELTELLWDEQPPPGARGAVQAYVMRLRHALGDTPGQQLIRTAADGYLFATPPETVDHVRFRRLACMADRSAAAGQLSLASRQLDEALELWRGPAFADIESDLLRREVPVLAEQRLIAIERRIEIELALGHHRRVISELRALVAEHPLRERYWYLLMLALHHSGWRADALAAYRRARRLLTDELGIEPGDELRKLHEAVLADRPIAGVDKCARYGGTGSSADDGLAGHASPGDGRPNNARVTPRPPEGSRQIRCVPGGGLAGGHASVTVRAGGSRDPWVRQCQLPRDVGDFVGRVATAGQLTAELTAGSAVVPVVVLSGPPGVGKTALAIRVAHHVRRAFPDGQLYARLSGAGGRPRRVSAILAELMIATGLCRNSIPEKLDQRAAVFRAWLADRRVLVVLDDAAGAPQVRSLLPGTPGCAVLATGRTDLRGLTALDGASGHVLDVLQPPEALALLSHILGEDRVAAEFAAAEDLAAVCGHLPLALRISAANLASRPGQRLGSYVAELRAEDLLAKLCVNGDPAAAVHAAFDTSYDALDPVLRRLFGLLGLLPRPDFTPGDAAALLDTDAAQAARLLDRLAAASLIHLHAPGRFRFHNLLKTYAAQKASA